MSTTVEPLTQPIKQASGTLPKKAVTFVKHLLETGILPENLPVHYEGLIRTFGPHPAVNATIYNTKSFGKVGETWGGGLEFYTPRMLGCPLPSCEAKPLVTSFDSDTQDKIDKNSMRLTNFLSILSRHLAWQTSPQPSSPKGQTCSVLYTSSRALSHSHTMLNHMSHFDLNQTDKEKLWDAHSIHYNVMVSILGQMFTYLLDFQTADMVSVKEVYIPVWIDPLEPQLNSRIRFMVRFYRTSQGKYGIEYIENHQYCPIPTESTYIILANIPWWNKPSPHGQW